MKRRRFGRRKVCKFCADKVDLVDYKDVRRLRSFVSERGKIIPRRISGSCSRHQRDRKSTRLNSSHLVISYAVFCLKKKKNTIIILCTMRERPQIRRDGR